jgi:transposase-like protein
MGTEIDHPLEGAAFARSYNRWVGEHLAGQRCRTQYATNFLMAITPKASWPRVRTLLHSVYDQPDADTVAAQYDRIVDALSDKLPKVADYLESARADLLAFTAFPNISGARSGRTTPRNDSTRRSAA